MAKGLTGPPDMHISHLKYATSSFTSSKVVILITLTIQQCLCFNCIYMHFVFLYFQKNSYDIVKV